MNPLLLSDDHPGAVGARLERICADQDLHIRFLNTLSLMEHIGSRKIMLAKPRVPDSAMLKHLAEETRHAWFFKRAAEKLAGRALDYDDGVLLAGAAARMYMDRLDAGISSAISPSEGPLPYLYMSLIIERRAIWAYRVYQSVLAARNCGISLAGVLAEEDLHLHKMLSGIGARDPRSHDRMPVFCAMEQENFRRFWSAVEHGCGCARC
jgi:hypothetical protein